MKRLTQKILPKLKQLIVELNLFKVQTNDNNVGRRIRHQRIITRVYILFLLLSFIILTINLAIIPTIRVETVNNPSISDFSSLQSSYASSLQCSCSSISIPYNTFFTIKPHYHHMCSSDIISSFWLELHGAANILQREFVSVAYHINAGSLFLLLSTLCDHTQQTIDISYQVFLKDMLVTAQTIGEEQFRLETDELFNNWKTTMINSFLHTVQLIRTVYHGNHLAGAYSNSFLDLSEPWNIFPSMFRLNSSFYYDECNCMLSARCRSAMKVYYMTSTTVDYIFDVPGLYMGCSRLEALFSSTLECFYNQTCMDRVTYYNFEWYKGQLNFTALDSNLNSPNETIESVVNRMFVDKWFRNVSYNDYYMTCAPSSCTYEHKQRRSLVAIITAVISIFGGLTTGLQILFILFLHFLAKITTGTRLSVRAIRIWFLAAQNNEQRLKTRITAILLLSTFFTISLIYILLHVSVTNQISKPSYEIYEDLLVKHSDTLQCPCSRMSIQYKSFLNLSVLNRHQVCSSDFITDKWIETFLLPDLQSTYSPTEFRTSAIGFFQLLASLCQFTEKYLTDELSALRNKSLIHSQVVSPIQLNIQIQSIIEQFQADTSNSFLNSLELIRLMINNNSLISLFQTNWKWTDLIFVNHSHWGKIVHTKPVVYDSTCNCGLSSQCVQDISATPGLKVGCYPLEALLQSNLQCLYNDSCIHLIQSTNQSFTPLNISLPSKYKLDYSVQSILNQLMIEEWISNVSYNKYYGICSPSFCSYSYMTRRSSLDILSSLLGLYSGLAIITTTLVTVSVHIWQKRHTRVQPTSITL